MFIGISQTSLSTRAFTFYPMHVTLLSFNDQSRRKHTTNDRTVSEYVPVGFADSEDD